jgi:hypothetical protein
MRPKTSPRPLGESCARARADVDNDAVRQSWVDLIGADRSSRWAE